MENDARLVLRALPHRHPFLLVDKVLEYEAGKSIVARKNVTISEPFFEGHFPDAPVMPGVLILEALAQTCGVLVIFKRRRIGGRLFSVDRFGQMPLSPHRASGGCHDFALRVWSGGYGMYFVSRRARSGRQSGLRSANIGGARRKTIMPKIAEGAQVSDGARLADDVVVGRGAIIEADCEIGGGSEIGAYSIIWRGTRIGANNRIFPFCSLGGEPQDKKFRGEESRLIVGDGNTIREYCFFNRRHRCRRRRNAHRQRQLDYGICAFGA